MKNYFEDRGQVLRLHFNSSSDAFCTERAAHPFLETLKQDASGIIAPVTRLVDKRKPKLEPKLEPKYLITKQATRAG